MTQMPALGAARTLRPRNMNQGRSRRQANGKMRAAFLASRTGAVPVALQQSAVLRLRRLPIEALERLCEASWARLDVLLLPANSDQRYLMTVREKLEAWLEQGGTLVFNGHVAYPFLRWLQPFVASPPAGLAGLQLQRTASHPIFDGVALDALMYRRGVAGFYARGGNPAPSDALILHVVGPMQLPVDWLLTLPGGGRLFVHAGNDLWMFKPEDPAAACPVLQLLDWLAQSPVRA